MDKFVENSMDKFEDKSGDIVLKTVQKNVWYDKLASFLSSSPFYNGEQQRGAELLFQKLGEAIENGDSCLKDEHISAECMEIIQIYASDAVMHKPIVWDEPYLYLQRYWALEHQLAQAVKTLVEQNIPAQDVDYSHLFDDEYQRQALQKGISLPFCMITGGPGTGKTYILTRIVAVLKSLNPQLRIAMAAPTGKAAQRMQEALQIAFADENLRKANLYHPEFENQKTFTLHRLLGMGHRQISQFNQDNPLPYDVVVVDEASMLDLNMAKTLFSAIAPPTRLILLGDANQLSSVDVGYVLADLQQVEQLKPYHQTLLKSRRFVDDAMIGRFAHYIYRGKEVVAQDQALYVKSSQYKDFSVKQWLSVINPEIIKHQPIETELKNQKDWVGYYEITEDKRAQGIEQIYQQLGYGFLNYIKALKAFKAGQIDKQQLAIVFDQYRILVAMKHGDLGLNQINEKITQQIKQSLGVSSEAEWYLGRPVMMTYNDYQLGLSNGDIGICWTQIENNISGDVSYHVYFPSLQRDVAAARLPQSIQTAYALTIHKSQGSEFTHTAVVLDKHAENLLSKELLYTAITRAKKLVSIYSDQEALEQSFNVKTKRQSGLQQQIQRILKK